MCMTLQKVCFGVFFRPAVRRPVLQHRAPLVLKRCRVFASCSVVERMACCHLSLQTVSSSLHAGCPLQSAWRATKRRASCSGILKTHTLPRLCWQPPRVGRPQAGQASAAGQAGRRRGEGTEAKANPEPPARREPDRSEEGGGGGSRCGATAAIVASDGWRR